MYNYVRSRQLDGTYSNDPSVGSWIISGLRIARGWGDPTEAKWPYEGGAWPPKEPVEIDQAAKAERICAYQRVRSLDEIRQVISGRPGTAAFGRPVTAAFEIDLNDWKSPPNGVIALPSPRAKLAASHCVSLVGYNDQDRQLRFANSWGVNWGDKGYGSISYSYFERHHVEAWTVTAGAPRPPTLGSGIMELNWGCPDLLASSPLHGFEIYDAAEDECVGWAFVVERQWFADIEEYFVRPDYRGKGYGRHLAEMILASSHLSGRQLRLWVSHADQSALNSIPSVRTLQRLCLTPRPTGRRRWAPYVAM
jgi:GNAT superfamily N-acetyltransferase